VVDDRNAPLDPRILPVTRELLRGARNHDAAALHRLLAAPTPASVQALNQLLAQPGTYQQIITLLTKTHGASQDGFTNWPGFLLAGTNGQLDAADARVLGVTGHQDYKGIVINIGDGYAAKPYIPRMMIHQFGGAAGGSGASGSSGGTANPSWAHNLGSEVTVDGPGSASPGTGSPDAAAWGWVSAVRSGNLAGSCDYEAPSLQAACRSGAAGVSPAAVAGAGAMYADAALGYSAIEGTQALVVLTGIKCPPGSGTTCAVNSDPAHLLDSSTSFGSTYSSAFSLPGADILPMEQVGGQWYLASTN
jgi:hypothetical protein